MDKKGFNIIDQAYQAEIKTHRLRVREEIAAEKINNQGFGFHGEAEAEWKLAKYPQTFEEKNKSMEDHKAAKATREAKLLEEVDKRMAPLISALEEMHFGKLGRQHSLEAAQREEKIMAFKNRQRQREEIERQKNSKTIERSKEVSREVIQVQEKNLVMEQDNFKPTYVAKDFQKMNENQERIIEIQQKIEKFKVRTRSRVSPDMAKQQLDKGDQKVRAKGKPEKSIQSDFNKEFTDKSQGFSY